LTQRKDRGFRICLPRGYKWCGPGCSGPGAPINDVDACCKAHDDCYRKFGRSCRCDHEFMDCLRPKISSCSKEGRDAALLYKYMRIRQLFTCCFCKDCKAKNAPSSPTSDKRRWI
jgi:hypothetical protein